MVGRDKGWGGIWFGVGDGFGEGDGFWSGDELRGEGCEMRWGWRRDETTTGSGGRGLVEGDGLGEGNEFGRRWVWEWRRVWGGES